MKIFKRVIWSIFIFVAVFYVLPVGLLQIPSLQKKISREIAAGLTGKFQTEVRIGQIEWGFLNRIILKDVYLEDRTQNTLLEAKRLTADFDILPLFRKKWRINSVQLYTFQFNLSKETSGSPLNIQYILDIFAGPDSIKDENLIDLQIKSINLSGGSFSYREKDAPETPGKFNLKSFQLDDIASKINVRNFKSDQALDIIVKRLSFKEKNGFRIKQFAFDLKAGKEKAIMNQLSLELENTSLKIKDIEADYSKEPKLENAVFRLKIDNSDVYLKDLGSFVPALSQFEDKINVAGDFSGTTDNLNIQNLCFRYYNHLMFKTNANIKNLFNSNPETIFIDCRIDDSFFSPVAIERIVNNFGKNPFKLPETIRKIKSMNFQGNITGNPTDLSTNGTLDSEMGTLVANVTLATEDRNTLIFKGKIASPKLSLVTLTGSNDYGQTIFDVGFNIKQQTDKRFAGSIDGHVEQFEYRGHIYSNLSLKGDFTPESFNGTLDLDSPEGKVSASGLFLLKDINSEFKFTAKVTDLQLDKLNLTHKYKNASLSFDAGADLKGNNPDNFVGDITLHDIHFKTVKGSYDLDSLIIASVPSGTDKTLSIRSEILRGEIYGIYSFGTFIPKIKKTLALYLPSLFETNKKSFDPEENLFSFDVTVEDMTDISRILELPFVFREQTRITGQYNSIYDKFNLEADIHAAKFGDSGFENMKISLNNLTGEALLNLSGVSLQKNDYPLRFALRLNAGEDRVKTHLDWGNANEKYRGNLNLNAFFSKEKGKSVYTQIDVDQSSLVFNDSVWTVYPTKIQADSSTVKINYLLAAHNDQFLKITGALSRNPEEKLEVELRKVDLEYIFSSLNIKSLEFGGIATGFVKVQDVYKTRKLSTNLDVKNFSFNKVVFGDLNLTGKWDDKNQGVMMKGFVRKNDLSHVGIDGIIDPVKEYISINFDATNADMRFLRKYLNKVVQNLTGSITGNIRLFGDLNDPTVEGEVYAENCRFGIGFLNTFYTFSDIIKCDSDKIHVENIHLFDENGQPASATGYVKHNLFDDFNYSANVSFDNLLVLNTSKANNPMFYGTAYGSGTASLSGTEDVININVAVRNTENTKITLNFTEEPDIVDYDFVRFVQPRKDTVPVKTTGRSLASKNNPSNSNQGTELRLNLTLDANPQATIEMMMDPVSGDKISGYGSGNMQIQYGTKIPLRVMGTYTIERGKYNFSFQQVIYRNFDIQEGSSVSFHGDPYTADLNVKANYKLTANLGDLDQQLIKDQQRVNTTVNCILQLNGQMRHPAISFDLDLPNSTPELNRQVKSYLRTEDMMNRQVFYLLVLNTFYTSPEYGGSNARSNTDMSLLTSTLSTQLSNILDSFTDKIQLVGTKFHQSNEEGGNSTEMEFLLSSQLLDNRLIINGNFGYRDNPYLNGNNQGNNIHWIGDFDLEYKLTKKGGVRLKFFNRYNYRNYYNLAPEMTQGLGILFRKDFDRFPNLFEKKNNILSNDTTTVK
ncbi:MAG: translocation/assembly module TamB domain-containing protein [Dysgonamonadaceae bacterium]|jgi:hypothetical protein|nr:translocation/assembly module TamB domain-containing protein [Dysgonamonadaceae bacterium]